MPPLWLAGASPAEGTLNYFYYNKGKYMSKNATLDIYKIGSKVKLTEDVFGTIVAIHISGNNDISYECGWWNGRSYSTQVFHSSDIEVTLIEKTKIGFV